MRKKRERIRKMPENIFLTCFLAFNCMHENSTIILEEYKKSYFVNNVAGFYNYDFVKLKQ